MFGLLLADVTFAISADRLKYNSDPVIFVFG
jgi:hypothetical protein